MMMTKRPASDRPVPVDLTLRLEQAELLDRAASPLQAVSRRLLGSPSARRLLQGEWLGHAAHPLLTDLPLGAWMGTSILDLIGGRHSAPAADRLLAFGLLTALPTAVTGLAEWNQTDGAERRVGMVHAGANSAALGLYTASWLARRAGHRYIGTMLAMLGGGTATIAGYLGGHLTLVRKVSTRHPAFEGTAGRTARGTADADETDRVVYETARRLLRDRTSEYPLTHAEIASQSGLDLHLVLETLRELAGTRLDVVPLNGWARAEVRGVIPDTSAVGEQADRGRHLRS
jgi:hypothetical protein